VADLPSLIVLLLYGCLQVSLWLTQWMFGADFWEEVDRG